MMADARILRRRPANWSRIKWIRWRHFEWLPTRREMVTAWDDVRAWTRGYCNDCPRSVGGYSFWRCGMRRGHDLPHRSRNYVWDPTGVRFDPEPARYGVPYSADQRGRHNVLPTSTAARLAHGRQTRATMERIRAKRDPT